MSKFIHSHEPYSITNTNGKNSYTSQTTPDNVATECDVPAPIKYVVPIIFIPGILGSNIKDSNNNKVWYPDFSTLISYSKRDAMKRQIDLNPQKTEVGYDGDIKISKKKIPLITNEIAMARGWGSVIKIGYSDLLIYLESELNNPFKNHKDQKEDEFKGTEEWEKIVHPGNKKTHKVLGNWVSSGAVNLLTPDQYEDLADYSFPVFACGYNWLDSNMESANKIAVRMNNEIMAQIKKEFQDAKFKKFIIVTHSMGGLVARALIQHASVKNKIAGVIHGVMPASGAPAVYQRLTVGWDGWKASTGLLNSAKAWVVKFMFGDTSERLTATLASAPGTLELLPFANYSNVVDYPSKPKAWMFIKAKTPIGEITAALPRTNNPYEEVYKRKDSWWAMMNPSFIDPAGLLREMAQEKKIDDIYDIYRLNINIVKTLHDYIKDTYHANSYAHYCADKEHNAFGQVTWRCKEELNISSEEELIELMSLHAKKDLIEFPKFTKAKKNKTEVPEGIMINEDENIIADGIETYNLNNNAYKVDGIREIILDEKSNISKTNKATFILDIKPTSPGDGTVSYQSGQDVRANGRKFKNTFIINGYEHSESYNHKDVQLNTLYCISRIFCDIKQ